MKIDLSNSPDKPANPLKKILRHFLRESRWLKVSLTNHGKIKRGSNCYFGKDAEIYIPTSLHLGNNISIGSKFTSQVNLKIEDNCLISSQVSFIGNDHDLFDTTLTSYASGRLPPSNITLEGNNFIGFGAIILGSITIGKNAMVAAGALVNKDVAPNTIVAGIPAKKIGERYASSTSQKDELS